MLCLSRFTRSCKTPAIRFLVPHPPHHQTHSISHVPIQTSQPPDCKTTPTQPSSNAPSPQPPTDIDALLSTPTWSLSSLLPPSPTEDDNSSNPTPAKASISPTQLRHLLRLSALPPPATPAEEADLHATLSSQLHFVRAVRAVDVGGVEPLRAIRDETRDAARRSEVGVEALADALRAEELRGRHYRRIRRVRGEEGDEARTVDEGGEKGWEPLDAAGRRVGRFFVVEKR